MADARFAAPETLQGAVLKQPAGSLSDGSANKRLATLLTGVVEASRLLLVGDDLTAAMHQAFAALGERTGIGRVAVCAFREGDEAPGVGGAWWLEAVWEAPGVSSMQAVRGPGPYTAAGAPDLLAAHRAGRPFVADARAATRATRGHEAAAGIAGTAMLPVHVAGAYWGFVRVDGRPGERAWAADELTALAGVADALGAAVDRARREAVRREALAAERAAVADARASDAEHLSALLRGVVAASRALLDAPTFEAGIDAWLRTLAEAAGAEWATFGNFSDAPDAEDAAAVTHIAVWARPGVPRPPLSAVPRTTDFDGWIPRLRAGEVVQGLRGEFVDPRSRAYWDVVGCRAATILPVQVDGPVWGWILLGNAAERRRRDADVAVLLTASDGIGLAVRREEALRAALAERAARERAEQARATELAETNARLARSMTRLTCEASFDAFVYQLHRELCDLLGGAATSQFEIHGSRGSAAGRGRGRPGRRAARGPVVPARPRGVAGALAGGGRRPAHRLPAGRGADRCRARGVPAPT
jgi:GAF domain-containing protein